MSFFSCCRSSNPSAAGAGNEVDVEVERLPDDFHLRKIYYYTDCDGRIRQFSVKVELNGGDADSAQKLYNKLRAKYLAMESFDLHSLVGRCNDATRLDVTEDEDVKALRDLFEKVDRVKGFSTHRWPSYRDHARGDMGANECLVLPSTKQAQKISKMNHEDLLKLPGMEKLKDDKKNKLELLTLFLENSRKHLQGMVDNHKELANKEKDAEKAAIYSGEILKLEELKQRFLSCDKFPFYIAILLEESNSIPDNIELVTKLFRKKDGSVSDEEQDYIKDLVLLNAKDRGEYVTLSKQLGHPVKKDPLAWVILNAMSQSADKGGPAFFDHPLIKDAKLSDETMEEMKNGMML